MNEEELEQTEKQETPENISDSTEIPEIPKSSPESPETPTKKTINPKVLGGIVGVVAVMGLCFALFRGSDSAAEEMRLEKYQGSLTLQNSTETKEVVEGSRLVSQDNLETFEESSAYISLDKAKILKLDEESNMEVVKVEEHLDIELYKGSLYFSVTEPLTDDETLEFHTNNVVTGVRGTSGVITYTEDLLQSQVVVLSGTVEVVTIEEEPELVLVNQGEIAIATTQADGSVTLEVKEQEKTASYSFSTHFLDDSGEDVEEYTQPDWYEAYVQHLEEIETIYADSSTLDLSSYIQSLTFPTDLSKTTYWLHDMDLDGIPELFLGFRYQSRGIVENETRIIERKYQEMVLICYPRDENMTVRHGDYIYLVEEDSYFDGNTGYNESYQKYHLSIPADGIGIYSNVEISSLGVSYGKTVYEIAGVKTEYFYEKNNNNVESTHFPNEAGNYVLLDGTPIDTSTWTHYTDLSGLEWNG